MRSFFNGAPCWDLAKKESSVGDVQTSTRKACPSFLCVLLSLRLSLRFSCQHYKVVSSAWKCTSFKKTFLRNTILRIFIIEELCHCGKRSDSLTKINRSTKFIMQLTMRRKKKLKKSLHVEQKRNKIQYTKSVSRIASEKNCIRETWPVIINDTSTTHIIFITRNGWLCTYSSYITSSRQRTGTQRGHDELIYWLKQSPDTVVLPHI